MGINPLFVAQVNKETSDHVYFLVKTMDAAQTMRCFLDNVSPAEAAPPLRLPVITQEEQRQVFTQLRAIQLRVTGRQKTGIIVILDTCPVSQLGSTLDGFFLDVFLGGIAPPWLVLSHIGKGLGAPFIDTQLAFEVGMLLGVLPWRKVCWVWIGCRLILLPVTDFIAKPESMEPILRILARACTCCSKPATVMCSCLKARYCSKACQEAHWKRTENSHKDATGVHTLPKKKKTTDKQTNTE